MAFIDNFSLFGDYIALFNQGKDLLMYGFYLQGGLCSEVAINMFDCILDAV